MNEFEEMYTQAVEKAGASIVSVRSTVSRGPCCGPFHRRGMGSGIVLDKEGHVLVSQHVLCQMDQVTVLLGNGHVFTGKVVGEDPRTDIAVIKIESDELVPAELGDSDKVKVGQPILALGNSLGLPGGPTATSGVISYNPKASVMGQNGMGILATDASVNLGNTGGPIVSLDGTVLAVNATRAPFAEGISFAVPINTAKNIADQIIKNGKVQRAWLGVTAYNVTPFLAHQFQYPDMEGVFVAEVVAEGPAEVAGMRFGDVLLSIGDKRVGNVSDLLAALDGSDAGQMVDVKVRRNGKMEDLHVTLGARPN
jgi:serine protease Do